MFGYPGGAILPAYDAMLDFPIRHVLVRHEQGATHMADGYARASGKVGVAVATSGPGATNMVTGIATAMMDSSPIVCITGQVGSALIGSDAFQETDITGITLPITKHNYLVTRAADVAPAIREAFAIAASGRPGPVLVDITKDAQLGKCEFDWDAAAPDLAALARPGHSIGVDPLALINARRAAADPRRPRHHPRRRGGGAAGVCGEGADSGRDDAAWHRRLSGVASAEPRHDGHARRSVGQHRHSGSRSAHRARHAVRRSRDRESQDLRANAKKIHVDIDPCEFNKNVRVDAAVSGDVGAIVREWMPRVADRRPIEMDRLTSPSSRATRPFATSRTCPTTATCTPRT